MWRHRRAGASSKCLPNGSERESCRSNASAQAAGVAKRVEGEAVNKITTIRCAVWEIPSLRGRSERYLVALIEQEYAERAMRRASREHAHVIHQVHILLRVLSDDVVIPVDQDAHLLHHCQLRSVVRREVHGRRGREELRRGPRRCKRASPATGARRHRAADDCEHFRPRQPRFRRGTRRSRHEQRIIKQGPVVARGRTSPCTAFIKKAGAPAAQGPATARSDPVAQRSGSAVSRAPQASVTLVSLRRHAPRRTVFYTPLASAICCLSCYTCLLDLSGNWREMSTKATVHGTVPGLTHAWLLARIIVTSPGFSRVGAACSSTCSSSSPESTTP